MNVTSNCHLPVSATLNNFLPMKSCSNAKFMQMRRCIAAMLAGLGLALCVQAQDTNFNFQATQAAADKGDAKAQYELARYYAKGMGVPKDDVKAAQYLRQSADQGYADAQVMFGSCYGRGQGV